MTAVSFVGLIAFIVTLAYTCLGIPIQIQKNFKQKSVKGLSFFMTVLMLIVFISWCVYAVLKRDWYILGSNAPGVVCVTIILGQFRYYRKNKDNRR
jgi:uncharacterized protein with PQ loop repeat